MSEQEKDATVDTSVEAIRAARGEFDAILIRQRGLERTPLRMSIPARPDDSDVVIHEAFNHLEGLMAEIATLRGQLAEAQAREAKLREMLAEADAAVASGRTVLLTRDEDGDVFVEVRPFKGCIAHGSTVVEALQVSAEAQESWLRIAASFTPPQSPKA